MEMWRFGIVVCVIVLIGVCGAQDRIIYPSDDDDSMSTRRNALIPLRIPEKLLIQLKDVHNRTDLIQRFVVPHNRPSGNETIMVFEDIAPIGPSILGKGRTPLSSAPATAVHGYCQPLLTTVELETPGHGAVYLFPSCVLLKRCSGCCTSNLLTCTPVKTSSVIVSVTQLVYNYNPDFPDAFDDHSSRSFTLEQHDQCACKCAVQPKDCGPQQEYREDECQCICRNLHQMSQCTSPKKVWDKADCACKCRQVLDCSTGFQFHPRKCRCERIKNNLAAYNATALNPSFPLLASTTSNATNTSHFSTPTSVHARV